MPRIVDLYRIFVDIRNIFFIFFRFQVLKIFLDILNILIFIFVIYIFKAQKT